METLTARDNFTQYLRNGNFRFTSERFVVFDSVMESTGHFDADELFLRLRTHGHKISRATVYNTLDLLASCGLVAKHTFGENIARYEKTHGRPHHAHLICMECGTIIEFVHSKIIRAEQDICRENNFHAHSSSFQIYGLCEKCQRKHR